VDAGDRNRFMRRSKLLLWGVVSFLSPFFLVFERSGYSFCVNQVWIMVVDFCCTGEEADVFKLAEFSFYFSGSFGIFTGSAGPEKCGDAEYG